MFKKNNNIILYSKSSIFQKKYLVFKRLYSYERNRNDLFSLIIKNNNYKFLLNYKILKKKIQNIISKSFYFLFYISFNKLYYSSNK